MVNPISVAGTYVTHSSGTGSDLTSQAITTVALGNAVIFTSRYDATSPTISSLSGGNCTWSRLAGPFAGSIGVNIDMWMGLVSSVGSGTITVTYSGSTGSNGNCFDYLEFTSGGGAGTVWALDGTAGTKNNTTSSTTVTFPTLVPSGSNRMYIGNSVLGNSITTTGQTSGYTVEHSGDNNGAPFFNTSVSTSQSPICKQNTAGTSVTIAVLLTATNPSYIPPLLTTPAPRFRSFDW